MIQVTVMNGAEFFSTESMKSPLVSISIEPETADSGECERSETVDSKESNFLF